MLEPLPRSLYQYVHERIEFNVISSDIEEPSNVVQSCEYHRMRFIFLKLLPKLPQSIEIKSVHEQVSDLCKLLGY